MELGADLLRDRGEDMDLFGGELVEDQVSDSVDVSGFGLFEGVSPGLGEGDVGTAGVVRTVLAGDEAAALHAG